MLSTGNKAQIIDIISKYLIEKLEIANFRGKFVVTFPEDILVSAENNVSKRTDNQTIIKQCMACVKHGINHLKVICDKTDIFVDSICDLLQEKGPSNFAFSTAFRRF